MNTELNDAKQKDEPAKLGAKSTVDTKKPTATTKTGAKPKTTSAPAPNSPGYVIVLKYIPTPTKTSDEKDDKAKADTGKATSEPGGDLGNVVLSSFSSQIDPNVIASLVIPVSTLDPETPEVITTVNEYDLFGDPGFPGEGEVLTTKLTVGPVKEGEAYEYENGKITKSESISGKKNCVLIRNASNNKMTFGLAQPLGTKTQPPKGKTPITAVYVPPWQTLALMLDLEYSLWWVADNKKKPISNGSLVGQENVNEPLNLKLGDGVVSTVVGLFGDRLVSLNQDVIKRS